MNPANVMPELQKYTGPRSPAVVNQDVLNMIENAQCVMCSSSESLTQRTFQHNYIPPLAYIAVVLGPVLGLLLLVILRVQHDITLPFCRACWKRKTGADRLAVISVAAFVPSIIFGVVLLLNLDSGIAFFILPVASIAFMVFALVKKRRTQPRSKKTSRQEVVVSAGVYGDLVFRKITTAGPFRH
jgi:hypothetical protein